MTRAFGTRGQVICPICLAMVTKLLNYGGIIMIIFDRLWETMKEKGVSTYTLWEKYNVDSRTIRRLKTNKNVTTNTLNTFSEILDCRLQDIAEYVKD